jgi:hypothetical protein
MPAVQQFMDRPVDENCDSEVIKLECWICMKLLRSEEIQFHVLSGIVYVNTDISTAICDVYCK